MSQRIYADIIWKFAPADYQGNNFFIGEVCEKLDTQTIQVEVVTTELPSVLKDKKHKISVEISLTAENITDEDAAVSLIQDKIIAAGLPCEYLILIDTVNTEFEERQTSKEEIEAEKADHERDCELR